MTLNILGTKYTFRYVNAGDDPVIDRMHYSGYCSRAERLIVILRLRSLPEYEEESYEIVKEREKETLRHEILHAFFNESGLDCNTLTVDGWAKNEEMVDWFAIQFPKILAVYEKAGAI